MLTNDVFVVVALSPGLQFVNKSPLEATILCVMLIQLKYSN